MCLVGRALGGSSNTPLADEIAAMPSIESAVDQLLEMT
jgi:hypothetical protein